MSSAVPFGSRQQPLVKRISARIRDRWVGHENLRQSWAAELLAAVQRQNAECQAALTAGVDNQINALKDELVAFVSEQLTRLAVNVPAQEFTSPPAITNEDWHRIERQGLFIIGSARSGTTIFANCLNLSPEVLMLGEPDLVVNQNEPDFVGFFNQRHRGYGNSPRKGVFVPPPRTSERGAFEFLNRMSRRYRYVGEKLAIGPPPNFLGDNWQESCLSFYARYFYGSTYFLILRRPAEVMWSMKKLFPDRNAPAVLESWLTGTMFVLDMYQTFDKCYMIFFDRLSVDMLQDVARILDIDLYVPDGMIDDRVKHSALGERPLPGFLQPYAFLCQECQFQYERLRESFCPHSFRHNRLENIAGHIDDVRVILTQLLLEVRSLPVESAQAA